MTTASSSQRWTSAIQDLFACVRGRLPAGFLDRKLTDLGLTGVGPLPAGDISRFEKAIDLVNTLAAGQPAPAGVKPDVALDAAFPPDHVTLGGLKALALEHIAAMRPAKAKKNKAQAEAVEPPPSSAPQRESRERRERPAPPPRLARIGWEGWLARHFTEPVAPVAASGEAPAVTAEQAPVVAPVQYFVPPALGHWLVDTDAKRQLSRLRERVAEVLQATAAGTDPASALREVAFAILRPPLAVRDDLRALIVEHFQTKGLTVTVSALHPPAPLAALRRDWETLLAARGPEDPTVAAAWKKMVDAHPEAREKLEAERARELDDLIRRLVAAARSEGEEAAVVSEARQRIAARFTGVDERIATELAQVRAIAEAAAQVGRLVAARHWSDPEVAAAIAALDGAARERVTQQRRHELDELDRRLRSALKEHGPDSEPTRAAQKHLAARFPGEGAAAAQRLARIKRGEDLASQEQQRRNEGRALSNVHLGVAEHRIAKLKPAAAWRLVVALAGSRARGDGKGRRPGHAVGLLMSAPLEHGPVTAAWRAADGADLDEHDAIVQRVADLDGGVLGLPLADCPTQGNDAWTDAVHALLALIACALPRTGPTSVQIELPSWADPVDGGALSAVGRTFDLEVTCATVADHAAALAEAVAWSWGGRREAEVARIRQSGLTATCLLEPGPALRDALAALITNAAPTWTVWSALLEEAEADPIGASAAVLVQHSVRLAANGEAAIAMHRHLTAQTRGRIADAPRLARELSWFDALAPAGLRARDRLRLAGALVIVLAAARRPLADAVNRLGLRLAELREDAPAEVVEAALHAAAALREGGEPAQAEYLLQPWQRSEAIACGGRGLYIRLAEERARLALIDGRAKDARKQLDRAEEAAAKLIDAQDRAQYQARIVTLRVGLDDAGSAAPAAVADEAVPD